MSSNDLFAPEQLSFIANGARYVSVDGRLAELVQVKQETAWDGCSTLYDGEQFLLSAETKKRARMRGEFPRLRSWGEVVQFLDSEVRKKMESLSPA